MAAWNTKKHHFKEDLYLSTTCLVSKDLVEFLADFQLDAIRFLWKHFISSQGCIFSAESGLGKISTVLAFGSAILPGRIAVLCKNPEGIHHWTYQIGVFSLPEDNFTFTTLDSVEEVPGNVTYLIIDARHSATLTSEEILRLESISCKKRVFISSTDLEENLDYLKKLLQCVDRKWHNLLRKTEDVQLIISHAQKFMLKQLRKQYASELPLRDELLYRTGFEALHKSPEKTLEILSQESERGFPICRRLRRRFFNSSDSGTPELIFSEEEIIKTSSRVVQSSQESDLVIPPSPDDSEPLFRRRPHRQKIPSTQVSGRETPNLFDSSVESEPEDKGALNTSTPLSKEAPDNFVVSQSPIPAPEAVNITHNGSEVFEITTNPTFSNQIRVSSKLEVSPVSTPKTPESTKSLPSTSGKWEKSTKKTEQDKCDTPRSSMKSSGWLMKESPKRSPYKRLTPRNLSVTFEVRRREEEALVEAFSRPIPTQETEEEFPRKRRRRLRDFLVSSEEEEF
ncbi:protein suppressor of underreplication [Phlebotomus argentipes]|uniref:protein suppressor of underreplication n=1 Tax=Phlebotomus argentipes TaxID=94469 RepID=UPI0028936AB2|nr:protein suppressor of underreplication [Phlebotomus argentipes]